MQMQIIHLDSYDDITSIKDKMTTGKKSHILLVWPIKSSLIEGRLELKLLKRYAISMASPIAIVSKNNQILKHAEILEIPVFRSIRGAKKALPNLFSLSENVDHPDLLPNTNSENWRIKEANIKSIRNNQKSLPTKTRYLTLLVGILSIMFLSGILFPSIDIFINPLISTQKLPITLRIRPGLVNYSISGAIPTVKYSTIVEGQKEINVTGELIFPIDKAIGEIQFTNLTDQPLEIPANQTLKTNDEFPEKFITLENAVFSGVPGETLIIPIIAINPGIEGNIGEGLINIIDGEFSFRVSVTNPNATFGGAERVSHGPSDQDYDVLLHSLIFSLTETALTEIEGSIGAGDLILYDLPIETQIILQEYFPPIPQPTNSISLKLQISVEVHVLSKKQIISLGEQLLDLAKEDGYSNSKNVTTVSLNNDPYFNNNGELLFDVVFNRGLFKELDVNAVKSEITGMSLDELSNYLYTNVPIKLEPTYDISPEWWPLVPISPLNIEFIYENN